MKRPMPEFRHLILALSLSAVLLAGCELAAIPQGNATPTVESIVETDVSVEPSLTPSATLTSIPELESPTPTATPAPPTETFTPSPTPGPYEYVIQQNDTLIYIIQQPPFNYRDLNVIDTIIAMNPNILSADRLPPPGSTILIPRQTPTPTPEGFELTAVAQPPTPEGVQLPVDTEIISVGVAEGQTIIGIAQENATTLVILATLNPDIGFFNCDFNNPSGGPDCTVPLQVGQQVRVPAATPTPTLSPTFSGNETATPTPTYSAPMAVFPPQDASAPPRTFQLQWVSVGILRAEEQYLVQVEDTTSGATHNGITRATSYELPEDMVPSDGQPHVIRWRVAVAAPNAQGAYRIISGEPAWRSFTWQNR